MKELGKLPVSRAVFGVMAVGAVAFTYFGILEPKDFMSLASMTFGYYFGDRMTD